MAEAPGNDYPATRSALSGASEDISRLRCVKRRRLIHCAKSTSQLIRIQPRCREGLENSRHIALCTAWRSLIVVSAVSADRDDAGGSGREDESCAAESLLYRDSRVDSIRLLCRTNFPAHGALQVADGVRVLGWDGLQLPRWPSLS